MGPDLPISPKVILVTASMAPPDLTNYAKADSFLRSLSRSLDSERELVHVVVIFTDLFVWASNVSVANTDRDSADFVQTAIRADWEFNAGVRPSWWPHDHEADRMWGVHYREDRDNGRAELARMRLDRYDLRPLELSPLPPRDQYTDPRVTPVN